jgi:hypothetical protein
MNYVSPTGIKELQLTLLEKHVAWNIISEEQGVLKMGKYFYIGMDKPAPMPSAWWEIDCHLLGFLTERKCQLLGREQKDFIEHFILGKRYKKYRRVLKIA